jgi:hypothetical protein
MLGSTSPAALALVAIIAVADAISLRPVSAEPYCPNPARGVPAKVPSDLVPIVAKTFGIDSEIIANGAFVKLMACAVGANLVCDKADQRRERPGATAWCKDNPRSDSIPMAAIGHATIYEWSCKRRRAIAGKTIVTVDPEGYIAENWKEVHAH